MLSRKKSYAAGGPTLYRLLLWADLVTITLLIELYPMVPFPPIVLEGNQITHGRPHSPTPDTGSTVCIFTAGARQLWPEKLGRSVGAPRPTDRAPTDASNGGRSWSGRDQ